MPGETLHHRDIWYIYLHWRFGEGYWWYLLVKFSSNSCILQWMKYCLQTEHQTRSSANPHLGRSVQLVTSPPSRPSPPRLLGRPWTLVQWCLSRKAPHFSEHWSKLYSSLTFAHLSVLVTRGSLRRYDGARIQISVQRRISSGKSQSGISIGEIDHIFISHF